MPPDAPPPPAHRAGSHDPQLTCKKIIVDLLQQYLEDATSPDLTIAITAHITACPPCVKFVDDYKFTRDVVKELRFEDIPPEFSIRLTEVIRVAMRTAHEK